MNVLWRHAHRTQLLTVERHTLDHAGQAVAQTFRLQRSHFILRDCLDRVPDWGFHHSASTNAILQEPV